MSYFTSCSNKNSIKNYKFNITFEVPSVFGATSYKEGEIENITAVNDSLAYCDAYRKYCLAKKVYGEYADKYNSSFPSDVVNTPISFKLINESGDDIAKTVDIIDKSKIEMEIEKEIQKLPNSLK